jgi:transcription elongation factor/antiterminator RfaH
LALNWYVIHSKPHKEDLLWSQLRSRDLTVYYPRIRVEPVNPRARQVVPFFPGYLFVQVDLEETPLSKLMYVPGAHRVVSFDGRPATVAEDVIQALQVQITAINAGKHPKNDGLKRGDPVNIKSGPFKGVEAIFDQNLDGRGRVRILIKILRDRQMRLEVSRGTIASQQS